MFGLSTAKLIAGAVAVTLLVSVVGGFLIERSHDKAKITTLTAANAQLEAVNQANVAEVAKIKADADASLAAVKSDAARAQTLATTKATIHQEIANAPVSDDGSVAPVLARTLDSLFPVAPSAGGVPGGQAKH